MQQGANAFLDKASRNEGAGGAVPLIPGTIVETVVTKAKDKRLIHVTDSADSVSTAITKEWPNLTIGKLLLQDNKPICSLYGRFTYNAKCLGLSPDVALPMKNVDATRRSKHRESLPA